jgi:hypothetical protein
VKPNENGAAANGRQGNVMENERDKQRAIGILLVLGSILTLIALWNGPSGSTK